MMITDNIKLIKKFSEKLEKFLYNDEIEEIEDYNVKIIVGQDYNKKTFKAHLYIIRAMCPYFNTAFKKDWSKKDDDGFFFIEKPNIKPEVFEVIIKYIYSGTFSVDKKSPEFLFEIIIASDELLLPELCSYIETHLIKSHSTYLSQNFPYTLHISFDHSLWKQLQEFCLTKINKDPYSIFESKNFHSILPNFFKDIIKNDNLIMDEIDIWMSLIIWCKRQVIQKNFSNNQKIHYDNITRWPKKFKMIFTKIIKEFIPFIRFNLISYKDFFDKVKPLKEFIQQDIYERALWYYINPIIITESVYNRRLELIDSNLLKLKHITLICSWIDRKSETYSYNNLPYKFELKIRGTLDGFTASTFQNKCKKLENTFIIMRVKDTDELIGGYNPYSFEHDRWKDPSDFWRCEYRSFIFSFPSETNSLNSKNNISWMKYNHLNFSTELKQLESRSRLSRIDPNHTSNAFYISKNAGPGFGKNDLFLGDNFNLPSSCSCTRQHYLNEIRDESLFCIDEYELFKIIRK
ncbi:hypothetical protein C1645_737193 [Glomus cerebriforme]|uniref:BTB/POZ domain-containing protein n=1 Tax=Glomus cerebriforme TaxID=658196 RepID=A0A397SZF9_9GLOM|nr:hypothetical protein C1645_737193 [Glomus cerebriforme]